MKKITYKELRSLVQALSQNAIQLQNRLSALEAVLVETKLIEVPHLIHKIANCEDVLEGFQPVEQVEVGDRVRLICEFPSTNTHRRFKLDNVAIDSNSPLAVLETLLLQGKVGSKMQFEESGELRNVTIETISRRVINVQ